MVIIDTNLIIDHLRLMRFADAAVAATCVVNDCALATFNTKDFTGIDGLRVQKLTSG